MHVCTIFDVVVAFWALTADNYNGLAIMKTCFSGQIIKMDFFLCFVQFYHLITGHVRTLSDNFGSYSAELFWTLVSLKGVVWAKI